MAFKFPFSTLHELNLDWILSKVKELTENNEEFNDKADYAVQTADEAKTIAEQAAEAQIGDGAVTTPKIADGAVTAAKLAANSVYSTNIVDGEVGTSDLAEGAVTTSRILDGAVTAAKIFDGAVTNTKIGNGAVATAQIADGAVNAVKLASNSILSDKLYTTTDTITDETLTGSETTHYFNFSVAKDGYTPLALLGYGVDGGSASNFFFNYGYLTNTGYFRGFCRSYNNSTVNGMHCFAAVLYIKN